MPKTAWQRAVGAKLRSGLSFPAAIRAARATYLPARRTRNPQIARYTRKKTVKGHYRRPTTRRVRTAFTFKNPSRRRARRNPEFSYTLGPVQANPRRRRTKRKNPWYGQKRRHAKAARKGWKRRTRRSFRRNPEFTYSVGPVVANARRSRRGKRRGLRHNPSLSGFISNPIGGVMSIKNFAMSFVKGDFITGTLLPVGGGFIGTKLLAGYVLPKFFKPGEKDTGDALAKKQKRWEAVIKYQPLCELGLGILSGAAIGMITKKHAFAVKWVTGSAIAALATWLDRREEFTSRTLKGIGGLGAVSPEAKSELKQAVQREIQKAEAGMRGVDEYAAEEDDGVDGVEEYAADEDQEVGEYREADNAGVGLDTFLGAPRQAM